MGDIYYDECVRNNVSEMWACHNLPNDSGDVYHKHCSTIGAGAQWGCLDDTDYLDDYEAEYLDYQSVQDLDPDTVLHADHAIVEVVDHANVGVDIQIDANCVAASFLGQPCASSVHDSAIAIDQPDITVMVDTQPIGDGIHSAAVVLAMTFAFIFLINKKFG